MTVVTVLLLVAVCVVLVALYHHPRVSRLLTLSIAFLVAMWYVVPIVIGVSGFNDFARVHAVVDHDTFLRMASVETLVLLVCLLALFVPRPYWSPAAHSEVARTQVPAWLVLLGLTFAVVLTVGISGFVRGSLGASYVEQSSFVVTDQGSSLFNALGSLVLVRTLLTSFVYACLTVSWPSKRATMLIRLLAVVVVGTSTLEQLLIGSRLAVITPATLLLLYAQSRGWRMRRFVILGSAVVLVTVIVGGAMSIVIAAQRGSDALTARATITEVDILAKQESTESFLLRLVDELSIKFDSFSTGAILVQQFGAGSAGFRPLYGALIAVVPRQLMPEKPVPGSVDGTYMGHPSRLAAVVLGYNPLYATVGVSPVSVSIWQFGWIAGPLAAILLAVPYLYLLNGLLLARSVAARTFAFYLISVPSFLGVFPTADFAIMSVERIVVMWCLLAAGYFLLHMLAPVRSRDGLTRAGATA